jgi:hypothetical protein
MNVDDAGQKEALNLSFVSDAWWPLVTGFRARTAVSEIDRRMLELCVVIQVANDLKSGDLCIPGSDKFRDYRLQLLSWEEVERELPSYLEQAGIATELKPFIARLRDQLEERGEQQTRAFQTIVICDSKKVNRS